MSHFVLWPFLLLPFPTDDDDDDDAMSNAGVSSLWVTNPVGSQHIIISLSTGKTPSHTDDGALSNERYGDFMLTVLSCRESAGFYIREAIKLYSEWGSTKKVALLREKYSYLLVLK